MHVLWSLLDDDATVLYTRKLVLEAAGFLVELATGGEEGLHSVFAPTTPAQWWLITIWTG